jgi:uncharacterized protein (TIGR02391 family)
MLLTDADLKMVRQSLEETGGWDAELLQRTSALIHVGAFDEAVRNAFVLLEDRLRRSAGKEGVNMTGTRLADYALNAEQGPLAKHYGQNRAEREGLHALFAGGFKLFRNPTAHRVVDFDSIEARFILGFVNLLLHLLGKITANQPSSPFPDNVEEGLASIEKSTDAPLASRMRAFLNKCAKIGLTPRPSSKVWIAFRHYALTKQPTWQRAKPHPITIFYFYTHPGQQSLWFPVNQYQSCVVGFDTGWVAQKLRSLGFQTTGAHQDFNLLLKHHASQEFFNSVFEIVERTVTEFRATLEGPSA